MALQIGKLKKENNQWIIDYPDNWFVELKKETDCSTVFIKRGEWWEEVYCGVNVYLQNEYYQGPGVQVICGNKPTSVYFPIPNGVLGEWYAVHWYENNNFWQLEPGMLIRIPISINDGVSGTFHEAPMGKCICSVFINKSENKNKLGRIALDLEFMPFPKGLWFFDGESYQESELDLEWRSEDVALTFKMLGGYDVQTAFWLW